MTDKASDKLLGRYLYEYGSIYITPTHPGVMIAEDYFPEMGVTRYRFAKMLGVSQSYLAELMAGRRNVTANLALRLGRLFNQSPMMWITLQSHYDVKQAMKQYGDAIKEIEPFVWPVKE